MSGCRIGKVRLKGGGELHPLRPPSRDAVQKGMIERAVRMSKSYKEGEMCGYYLLSWNTEGEYSTSYYVGMDGPIGFGLLPSFAADALRRRMIEEGEWET